MDTVRIFFEVLVSLVFIYWSAHLIGAFFIVLKVPQISKLTEKLSLWPKVSVILTARNEALHLEKAMTMRLTEDYPNIEFILVNDRSTDATGDIVNKIASEDERIKAIHVKELPEGWLGKLNAMNEGLKVSVGEWILFSDADMFIKKGVLKRAISYVEKNGVDHLCIFPEFLADKFSLRVLFSGLTRVLSIGGRLWAIANPKSGAAVGVGGFNLVRRAAFEKTKGLDWIKMDVADDVALGTMMKRAGFKSAVLGGRGEVKVYLYKTWKDAIKGTEKASYTTIGSFSPIKVSVLFAALILELSPFYAFFFGIRPLFILLSLGAILVSTFTSIIIEQWLTGKKMPGLFWPFGLASMMSLVLYGFLRAWIKGGIDWRGTFYNSSTLKEGKRFFLFSKGRF